MAKIGKWSNNPFKGLGKALKAKGFTTGKPAVPAVPAVPADKRGLNMPAPEEKDPRTDEEIFLEAMDGTREIPSYRDLPAQSKAGKFKRKGRADSSIDELKDIVEQRADINISDTDEYDEWIPPGQSAGLARKLHKGECAIQDFIDLHGFKEDEAEAELVGFLEESRRRGFSCVKVIHGRGLRSPGEPVLKLMVARLLKGALSKYVRAFATAPPRDGGLGATYVLLRGK